MEKKRTSIFLIFFLCVPFLLFGCGDDKLPEPIPLSSQPTAKVVISPPSGAVSQGSVFTRTVEVQNLKGTFFAAFDVTYNPAVIEFQNVAEGTFLNKNGTDATSVQVALQNAAQGSVAVGLTRLGPIGDVSGSGMLLTLTFKAVGPGITRLAFQHPRGLKNSDNQDVTSSWEDGTVTVQ